MKNRVETSLTTRSHKPKSVNYPSPVVISIDDIAVMLDDDLLVLTNKLENERRGVFDERSDTRQWDEELAYLRRELQIRKTRREAHEKWLAQQVIESSQALAYEKSLPNADLDNSQFMFF